MLSDASKLFDPMGLLSPYTIRSKMLFQQLWNRGLQWDEQLPEDILQQWNAWKTELPKINEISIPRCFMQNGKFGTSVELHGFGDASPKAYDAVLYVRVTQQNGDVDTHLVMSKTRVAPAKVVSLPRLELLAAVINSRLLKFVAESLSASKEIERVVCWTDIRRLSLGSAEMDALSRGGKTRRLTDSWSNIDKSERERFVVERSFMVVIG